MKEFTLTSRFQTNVTLVANGFIDHYMVQANGEFVKVYLFLLRHLGGSSSSLSVSAIADCLNHTENDILRAFKYWESKQLLCMECDAKGEVCHLELLPVPASQISVSDSLPVRHPLPPSWHLFLLHLFLLHLSALQPRLCLTVFPLRIHSKHRNS